jgi:uncharacterized protein YcgI (DUF1989 family)
MIRADVHDRPADNGTALGENGTARNPISADGRPEIGVRYTVPAREGRAVRLSRGETISVINTHGTQVCDLWAFNAANSGEFLSWEHARGGLSRIAPRVGDALLTNRRRPILTMVEDTSPGVHDTLIAACDLFRYIGLGCEDYHDNCSDNLRMALAAIGARATEVPQPFNVWMNIPVMPDGAIDWLPTVSRPGDRVTLRAEMDCIVAMSACPQDMMPINGPDMRPVELHFEVSAA